VESIISIKNLTKKYDSGLLALNNINLDIHRGEILALLGPNGAGKTTLISIICGIVTPSEGSVSVDGHDILTNFRAARSKIGLVPQELSTATFESVWDTMNFSRGLFGKPKTMPLSKKSTRPLALGQTKREDYDIIRRHETPRSHRQGTFSRTRNPVS